jgi:sulfite reductase (NADPH) flavoprotein alpha-component
MSRTAEATASFECRRRSMRHRLALLHRWIALAFAPIFVALLLSGAVLAFRPLFRPRPVAAHVEPARIVALLEKAPPGLRFAGMEDDGRTLTFAERGGKQTSFDISTGEHVATPPERGADVFDAAERVHTELWVGLGWLIGLATFAMAALVLVGPFLRPLRRAPPNALGWHMRVGWLAWPLLAMLPLTIGLEKLRPSNTLDRAQPPMAPARAVEVASAAADMSGFRFVRPLPGGALIAAASGRVLVDAHGAHRLDTTASSLGKSLHEGTWSEPLGAMVSLLAAAGLSWMLFSGALFWWRKRRRRAS